MVRTHASRGFAPLLWTLIPYAYLTFGFTRAALGIEFRAGQKYPYPLMDLDVLGFGGVASGSSPSPLGWLRSGTCTWWSTRCWGGCRGLAVDRGHARLHWRGPRV